MSNSEKKQPQKQHDEYDDDFSEITNSEKKPGAQKTDEDTAYTEDEFDDDA